jgi:hypothetical protein
MPMPIETRICVAALALLTASSGCLSDRYKIPDEEVQRQLSLPPGQRGQSVQVLQNIGDRAAPAVPYGAPPAPPPGYYGGPGYPPGGYASSDARVGVFVGVNVSSGPGYSSGPPPQQMRRASPSMNPVEGSPVGRGRVGSAGSGGASPPGGGGFRGGSGGARTPSNDTSDAKAMAVLVVVAAVAVTVGAAATEGARYDGKVVMAPNQNVYLKRASGGEMVQPLDALAAQDLAGVSSVEVSDAEGYGLMLLGRNPLNRKGFSFKFDGGSMGTRLDSGSSRGAGANIQVGGFFTKQLGLMLTTTLTGGTDLSERGFFRSVFGAELQGFLPALGPLHLGGFGNIGALNREIDNAGSVSGMAFGVGALLEIELTTRLALDFRLAQSWANTSQEGTGSDGLGLTVGFAIY